MYLWNVDKLAVDLKQNKKNKELTLFTVLSPFLTIAMIALWVTLLISHLFIADIFSYFISGADVYLGFYNFLGLCAAGVAATFCCLSIMRCYELNKKADGKKFLLRFTCASAFIITHLLAYTLAVMCILGLLVVIVLARKTALFSAEVTQLLESHSIGASIKSALEATPLKELVPQSFYQDGIFSSLLSLPAKLIDLPKILQKLELLVRYYRGLLLGLYPVLITIPVAMAFIYTVSITNFFKLIQTRS